MVLSVSVLRATAIVLQCRDSSGRCGASTVHQRIVPTAATRRSVLWTRRLESSGSAGPTGSVAEPPEPTHTRLAGLGPGSQPPRLASGLGQRPPDISRAAGRRVWGRFGVHNKLDLGHIDLEMAARRLTIKCSCFCLFSKKSYELS